MNVIAYIAISVFTFEYKLYECLVHYVCVLCVQRT